VTPLYEREIWLKKRLGTLLKPIMGKIYDTKAPGYRRNDIVWRAWSFYSSSRWFMSD